MANEKVGLALAVLVALALRVPDVAYVPMWDWDEGVFHDLASNLAGGRALVFAAGYSWLPHPPAYFIVASRLILVAGDSLYAARLLSVSYGVLTVILLYFIGREVGGGNAGLAAASFYAMYPKAVYWDRIALPYNQLAVLSAALLLASLLYAKTGGMRRLYACAALVNLMVLTAYAGAAFLMALLLYVAWYRRGDFCAMAASSLILPALFVAFLAVSGGLSWFIEDAGGHAGYYGPLSLAFVLCFLAAVSALAGSEAMKRAFHGYVYVSGGKPGFGVLMFYLPFTLLIPLMPPSESLFFGVLDYFWIVAVMGFALIDGEDARTLVWSFYASYLLVLLALGRSDHLMTPLYPILCLGAGLIFSKLWDSRVIHAASVSRLLGAGVTPLAVSALLLLPFPLLLWQDYDAFILRHGVGEAPVGEAKRIAGLIGRDTGDGDLVITYSYFAPYTGGRKATMIQALAYDGYAVAYQQPLPRSRFRYNASIGSAKYLVVPKGLTGDFRLLGYAGAAEAMGGFELVYESPPQRSGETYQVYRRLDA
jgi:4-amino-4-deoxy-L-arabinose transferase-like glycosyltransferase